MFSDLLKSSDQLEMSFLNITIICSFSVLCESRELLFWILRITVLSTGGAVGRAEVVVGLAAGRSAASAIGGGATSAAGAAGRVGTSTFGGRVLTSAAGGGLRTPSATGRVATSGATVPASGVGVLTTAGPTGGVGTSSTAGVVATTSTAGAAGRVVTTSAAGAAGGVVTTAAAAAAGRVVTTSAAGAASGVVTTAAAGAAGTLATSSAEFKTGTPTVRVSPTEIGEALAAESVQCPHSYGNIRDNIKLHDRLQRNKTKHYMSNLACVQTNSCCWSGWWGGNNSCCWSGWNTCNFLSRIQDRYTHR